MDTNVANSRFSRTLAPAFCLLSIALATAARAQSIYYDDSWFFSGPTKLIPGSGTTCETAAICYRYCVKDHCAHGNGQLGSDGGWSYDGDFVDGYMDGKGTLTTDDYEYKGGIKHGAPHGHGVLICQGGGYFQGEWLNGSLNGKYVDLNGAPCGKE
jgi:hypothetical protein